MSDPVYTADWTTHHIPLWTDMLGKFKDRPNIRALEVGCFEGRSTRWFIENILTGAGSTITVVDPLEHIECPGTPTANTKQVFMRFRENTMLPYPHKVEFHRVPFVYNLAICTPFHFAYVDGSHRSEDVLHDCIKAWRWLYLGGILIIDDYGWECMPDPADRPKAGIDAFLSVFGRDMKVLHIGWQVIVEKTADGMSGYYSETMP